VGGCEANPYAESGKGVSRCLREPTGEKASIVTDDDDEAMTFRMTHSKGCSYSAGNQSNTLKGKIPGNDPAPTVCPEPNPWRRRHQWTKSDDMKPIVIIA
jgi:hypothetical protein